MKNIKDVEKIEFEAIVGYLIGGFSKISDVDDFEYKLKSFVANITEEPEVKSFDSIFNSQSPHGVSSHSFVFYPPDNMTWGIIDLDFVDKKLANVKIQLIEKHPPTIFSKMTIHIKKWSLTRFLQKKYGPSKKTSDLKELDKYRDLFNTKEERLAWNNQLLWKDLKQEQILAIKKGSLLGYKNVRYLSFSITNQDYT